MRAGETRYDVLATALGLGVLTGVRSLRAIALLATEQEDDARGWLRAHPLWTREPHRPIADALRSRALTRALRGGALAEALADKLPDLPARIEPVPLLGRAAIGALVGAAAAELANADRVAPALAGAAGAIAGAYGAYHLRRWVTEHTDVPDQVVAFAEDAVVFGAGKLLAKRLTA